MTRKPMRWGARLAAALLVAASPLVVASAAEATVADFAGSGVTAPAGVVWVPGGLGGHWWVSDHIQGFCRLDVSGASLVINGSTCSIAATSPGQPAVDAAAGLVYVPDLSSKSRGVVRLLVSSVTETVQETVQLAPGKGLGGNRPAAAALGSDGALYVSFLKNGNISRVTSPAGDPAVQLVQSAGVSSDGGRVVSLAAFGANLYLAEGAGVTRISNVAACARACRGTAVATGAVAPTALVSDGTRLFVGDVSAVLRHYPGTGLTETLATTGTYSQTVYPLSNVSALGLNPVGTLLIGDDPTAGAGVLTGRLWTTDSNGAALPGGGNPPPPPPPPPGPNPTPIAIADFAGSGVTAPAGVVWVPGGLGGHWWVSDHIQGFCRLDVSGASLVINGSTCSIAATSPGQPAVDAAAGLVYVPDLSSKSRGVVRLLVSSVTETVQETVQLAPGKGLGGNRPAAAALGSDGALYVSFLKNGNISRVTSPAGDPAVQLVQSAGVSSDGGRVVSLAAFGANLYLAEGAGVTRISNVAACARACRGTAVATGAVAPTALVSDGIRLFVGDVSAVLRHYPGTGLTETLATTGTYSQTVYPLSNVSALGLNPVGTLLIGDDPTAGAGVLTGRLWTVNSLAS